MQKCRQKGRDFFVKNDGKEWKEKWKKGQKKNLARIGNYKLQMGVWIVDRKEKGEKWGGRRRKGSMIKLKLQEAERKTVGRSPGLTLRFCSILIEMVGG